MKRCWLLLIWGVAFPVSANVDLGRGILPLWVNWDLKDKLKNPESAFYEAKSNTLYVSNVEGEGGKKDGKGEILKITLKGGKPKVSVLTKGLDAPKGLRFDGKTLWVSDIDRLVAINPKSGAVTKKIPIADAKFLNDVAVAKDGAVFVSDTIGSRIYRVKDGKSEVWAEGPQLEFPNGLFVSEEKLVVASWGVMIDPATFATSSPGRLYTLDLQTKQQENLTEPFGNLDGLERLSNGAWIVSDWVAGKLYLVKKDMKPILLAENFKNSADVGLDAASQTLYVPSMTTNRLLSIDLKRHPAMTASP